MAYVAALFALFVRFVDPEAARVSRRFVASDADLALVRRHQWIFYALVLAAPVEWVLRGRPGRAVQLVGLVCTFAGVVGYRLAGRALGDQLGPLVAPSEPAVLVEEGPYDRIRHPMYLAEIAIAFGVPLLFGLGWTLLLSVLFALAVLRRIDVEERALAARLPEYSAYQVRTHKFVPYVY